MGTVHRAHDVLLDEELALKWLRLELSAQPDMVVRFRREVKLSRRITHRNVARVYDLGMAEGRPFITMELLPEGTLADRLSHGEPRPLAEVLAVGVQVAEGLAAAHVEGVVHLDLKPENLLLDGERVAIADFGIAKALLASARRERWGLRATTGLAMGTPHYMAPEQVASRGFDERSDIYALGVVLFELLTGELPFDGASVYLIAAARISGPPPDPRECTAIPDEVAEIVLRCMALEPDDRFSRAEDVAVALRAISPTSGACAVAARSRVATNTVPSPGSASTMARASGHLHLVEVATSDLARGVVEALVTQLRRHRVVVRRRAAEGQAGTLVVSVAQGADDRVELTVVLRPEGREPEEQRLTPAPDELGASIDVLARHLASSMIAPAKHAAPSEVTVALARAVGAARRPGGLDEALSLVESAYADAGPSDAWRLTYARLLARRSAACLGLDAELDEAWRLAEGARSAPEAPSLRGLIALQQGDVVTAIEAVEVQPRLPEAALLRGRLLWRAGDVHDGLVWLREALDGAASHGDLRAEVALAELAAGRREVATRLAEGSAETFFEGLSLLRFALWQDAPEKLEAIHEQVGRSVFVGRDVLFAYASASRADLDHQAALVTLDAHAADALPEGRAAELLGLAGVELCLWRGDEAEARRRLVLAVRRGFGDAGWVARCPLLGPMRSTADSLLTSIRRRGRRIAKALEGRPPMPRAQEAP